jgi:hypothetical protein
MAKIDEGQAEDEQPGQQALQPTRQQPNLVAQHTDQSSDQQPRDCFRLFVTFQGETKNLILRV